jgi:hypothetical protein
MHVKGYAAPETKAAVEHARLLIERAEALGEPPEDPLLLYSVLYGFWVANLLAFNGDVCRDLAVHFLGLAEKQGMTVPLMIGHRLMGVTLVHMGRFAESRGHLDRALALYDPFAHRPLATGFGQDAGVTILGFRSWALWLLGYTEAALGDVKQAMSDAREIGQAATLMLALALVAWPHIFRGDYAAASSLIDEYFALAGEKGATFWKALGTMVRGDVLALTGNASVAVQTITSGMTAMQSTGATAYIPWAKPHLATRTVDPGLLVVHRRFRRARSEGSEHAVGRAV